MIDDIFYHAATLITLLSLFILGPALGRAWMTRIDGSQGWSVPTQHFVLGLFTMIAEQVVSEYAIGRVLVL